MLPNFRITKFAYSNNNWFLQYENACRNSKILCRNFYTEYKITWDQNFVLQARNIVDTLEQKFVYANTLNSFSAENLFAEKIQFS